eukprot:3569910-Alexandrium_andersonii.AAC.1
MSRQLYNMHTFSALTHAHEVTMRAEHMRALRIIMGNATKEKKSTLDRADLQILHDTGAVLVKAKLVLQRLQYLPRIIRNAPRVLQAMLCML